MTTNSQERLWRINECLKDIPKRETKKEKVVGKMMLKLGISRRTAFEYLTAMLAGDLIGDHEDKIWRVK